MRQGELRPLDKIVIIIIAVTIIIIIIFCFNDIFDLGRAEPSLHVNDKDKQIVSMVWT